MNNFTLVILGDKVTFKNELPFKVVYLKGKLKEFIKKNVDTKYVIFVKSEDLIGEKFFNEIINKTKHEFDCCFINFKCNYKNNNKIPTDYKELRHEIPLYGSYIFSFIFKTEKLLEALDITEIENFNDKVAEIFKVTDCINDIVYYHKPDGPRIIEEDTCYVDYKKYTHIKNAIYIAKGVSGTFNGYVSWLRNIGKIYGKKYKITLLNDGIGPLLKDEFNEYFDCVRVDYKTNYLCDRLLTTYSTFFYPRNLICIDKNYLFIHGNATDYENSKKYRDDIYTEYVAVSQTAAKSSIGYYPRDDIKCVYNPYILDKERIKPHLKLVTTMRSSNIKRPDRIEMFAKVLDELNIPYTWNFFTDVNENKNVNGLIYRRRTVNPMPYVNDSDYFVMFSDSESFSYSVVEALSVNTKVIVTPLEVYKEIGVEDGKNGYVIPFEYFEEKNKDKLKEFIKKIYKNKDNSFKYVFDEKLYEGFKDIFI